MSPRICSFAVLALALLALVGAQPASSATPPCGVKGAKLLKHNGSLRVYLAPKPYVGYDGKTYMAGQVYACSTKYGQRPWLSLCDFGSECLQSTRWNGRYLYYSYLSVAGATSGGERGLMVDLKTGKSEEYFSAPEINADVSPQCASFVCEIWIHRSVIGPGHSFALGYELYRSRWDSDSPPIVPEYIIEKHCLSTDMKVDTRVVLDHTTSQTDLASVHIVGRNVIWTVGGVKKSSELCK